MHKYLVGSLTALTMSFANAIMPVQAGEILEILDPDRDACFSRTYSAAHLGRNPNQTVEYIRFAHLPSLKQETYNSLAVDDTADFMPYADIEVRFVGDKTIYGVEVICEIYSAQYCGVEGDGGVFDIRIQDNGSMLIDFRKHWGILVGTVDSIGRDVYLGDKSDDKLFRLDPIEPRDCHAIVNHNG